MALECLALRACRRKPDRPEARRRQRHGPLRLAVIEVPIDQAVERVFNLHRGPVLPKGVGHVQIGRGDRVAHAGGNFVEHDTDGAAHGHLDQCPWRLLSGGARGQEERSAQQTCEQ